MKISKDSVVVMDYKLSLNDDDDIVDASSGGEFAFLAGHHNIVPGLESQLLGLEAGASGRFVVAPEEGYGVRDDGKIFAVPRSALPKNFHVEIGVPLQIEDEKGEVFPAWIAGTHGDDVVLDRNHPLAGDTLHFDITIVQVRKATREELAHGHVHGPGGHHH